MWKTGILDSWTDLRFKTRWLTFPSHNNFVCAHAAVQMDRTLVLPLYPPTQRPSHPQHALRHTADKQAAVYDPHLLLWACRSGLYQPQSNWDLSWNHSFAFYLFGVPLRLARDYSGAELWVLCRKSCTEFGLQVEGHCYWTELPSAGLYYNPAACLGCSSPQSVTSEPSACPWWDQLLTPNLEWRLPPSFHFCHLCTMWSYSDWGRQTLCRSLGTQGTQPSGCRGEQATE